jgi:hypothetical protein
VVMGEHEIAKSMLDDAAVASAAKQAATAAEPSRPVLVEKPVATS